MFNRSFQQGDAAGAITALPGAEEEMADEEEMAEMEGNLFLFDLI
jgi:hypothetical protein